PKRPAGGGVRLHRHRRRRARAVQPTRRLRGRCPPRRPPERRLHLAGGRLPVGARRRDARSHPLQRSGWGALPPLPPAQGAAPPRCNRHRAGSRGMINDSLLVIVLAQAVLYGTPLLYAALGELLAERSGVLNLGVEGMMLVGAVMGFWAVQRTGSLSVAVLVAAVAGGAMALLHALLVVPLRAHPVVSWH